jgi:hypothetical protein
MIITGRIKAFHPMDVYYRRGNLIGLPITIDGEYLECTDPTGINRLPVYLDGENYRMYLRGYGKVLGSRLLDPDVSVAFAGVLIETKDPDEE